MVEGLGERGSLKIEIGCANFGRVGVPKSQG